MTQHKPTTQNELAYLDVVDALAETVSLFLARVDIVELNVVIESFFAECHRLVDLDGVGELSVGFEVAGLVGGVLENDVGFAILVVSKTDLQVNKQNRLRQNKTG